MTPDSQHFKPVEPSIRRPLFFKCLLTIIYFSLLASSISGQERNAIDDSLAVILIETLSQKGLDQMSYRKAVTKFYNTCSTSQNTAIYLDSIIHLEAHSHYDFLKYYLINRQASILVNLKRYEEAELFLQEVIKSDIEEQYPWQFATAYVIMGWLNREKGRDGLALYFFNIGYELSVKYNVERTKAGVLNRLVLLHRLRGNYDIALEYADILVKSCEQDSLCQHYSNAINHKAEIYKALGDTSLYLKYLLQVIEIKKKALGTNSPHEYKYYHGKASWHLAHNQIDSFRYYKNLAQEGYYRLDYLAYAMELNIEEIADQVENGIYTFDEHQHNDLLSQFTPDMYNQKLEYYDILIKHAKKNNDVQLLSQLFLEKLEVDLYKENLLRDNYSYMQEYMTQEIERNKKYNLIESRSQRIRRTSILLGGVSVFLSIAAIVFYQLLKRLEKSNNTIQSMNAELRQQNHIITDANEEKATLLREIHHRVKNNLQVISALLTLQSEHLIDAEAKVALQHGKNRVESMALLHRDLYQYDNLKGVNTKVYLDRLIDNLFSSYQVNMGQVILEKNIDEIQLDIDTMIPLGLLINELISNALKHAYQPGVYGLLYIALKDHGDYLNLSIKDNGKGAEDMEVLRTKSFGYSLIDSFAKKLEAAVTFHHEEGLEVALRIHRFERA